MSTSITRHLQGLRLQWGFMLVGIAALCLPTYVSLYRTFWKFGDGGPPVMLAIVLWLFYRKRAEAVPAGHSSYDAAIGLALAISGCAFYFVGRTQTVYQIEVVSEIPLILGCISIMAGLNGLKKFLFPVSLLLCLIPVPGSILDEILFPMKEWVSDVVDNLLHFAGYPIARSGVTITIGPYYLMVADACSGMRSVTALFGAGLLYVYLSDSASRWTKVAILASIVPVALFTNILRVTGIVLVTYHFGEQEGASFHDVAGFLEIFVAFAALYGVERTSAAIQTAQRKHEMDVPDARRSL